MKLQILQAQVDGIIFAIVYTNSYNFIFAINHYGGTH